ncbi:OLC1v1011381C1 [Oldenlandia corymbosa var. corymbosa]|uniref:OLC1v1011381C1 n=1 Tax=Oldenlandia corymbosa var. corymbosa TaxID=529605 RepID=A0AAV1DTG9_OLDCO|nr:OLC1v1011381C1 [Oldenlandia corymbosa var. corymbosa]
MGFDDICTPGLVLGLGPSSTTIDIQKPKKLSSIKSESSNFEPSLTLSLSGEAFDRVIAKKLEAAGDPHTAVAAAAVAVHPPAAAAVVDDLHRQDSAASSFSNVSVKREREICSEDAEIERVSSRVSDEDDDGANGRKKLRLTKAQSALLEESFKQHSTLNPKQKQDLARELNLRPRQVEVWFQNRRAR